MNRWKLLLAAMLCAVCLITGASAETLETLETLESTDMVSLRLAYAGGTEIVKEASLPAGANLWYVFRTSSGRAVSAGLAASRAASGAAEPAESVLSIPTDADSVSFFALGDGLVPLLSGVRTALGALSESYAALYQEGTDLFRAGDWEGAVNVFTAAVIKDGNQPLARVGRGNARVCLAETAENLSAAQKDYDAALSLDKTCTGAYLGKTDVCIQRGEYENAEAVLKEGMEKAADAGKPEIQMKLNAVQSGTITDSQGRLRRSRVYDGGGTLLYWVDYAYGERGLLLSATAFDRNGTETSHFDLQYDEAGRPVVDFYEGHSLNSITFWRLEKNYDQNGNCTLQRRYYGDGSLYAVSRYEYDERGFLILEYTYNADNTLTGFYQFSYEGDNSEKYTRREWYDAHDVLQGYDTITYREDGHLSEQRLYYRDTAGDMVLYKRVVHYYDENDNHTGWTEYDGEGNVRSVSKYG